MSDRRFFEARLGLKEALFSKDVSASDDIADSLLILVCESDHQSTVQNKVDLIHLVTLSEYSLTFVKFDDLSVLDHEFVGVKADFSEDFVMQTDLFQT